MSGAVALLRRPVPRPPLPPRPPQSAAKSNGKMQERHGRTQSHGTTRRRRGLAHFSCEQKSLEPLLRPPNLLLLFP